MSDPELVFERLLVEHPEVFYSGRIARDLFCQWNRFRSCGVIPMTSTATAAHSGISTSDNASRLQQDFLCSASSTGFRPLEPELRVGGDPESFSDTELLLEETVSVALSAGLSKLKEPSTLARRRQMLGNSSYLGFQALATEAVFEALVSETLPQTTGQGNPNLTVSWPGGRPPLTSSIALGQSGTGVTGSPTAAFGLSASSPSSSTASCSGNVTYASQSVTCGGNAISSVSSSDDLRSGKLSDPAKNELHNLQAEVSYVKKNLMKVLHNLLQSCLIFQLSYKFLQ
ncbi:unnamed protein product [Protopolystoma xenopodis]|uniref:Uncharacterized protein n=1 Tax=Protopolystoma xenopodis TaxID=117903 RepID=A0A448XPR9_9PLAT|nr:unnamed protein product [Protopolystoma xenopodis]